MQKAYNTGSTAKMKFKNTNHINSNTFGCYTLRLVVA